MAMSKEEKYRRTAEWKAKNRDRVCEYQRQYMDNHPEQQEKARLRAAQYRIAQPEIAIRSKQTAKNKANAVLRTQKWLAKLPSDRKEEVIARHTACNYFRRKVVPPTTELLEVKTLLIKIQRRIKNAKPE